MKKIVGLISFFFLGVSILFGQGTREDQVNEALKKLMSDSSLMQSGDNDFSSSLKNMFGACTIQPAYSFTSEVVSDMYFVGKKPKDSFSMHQTIYVNSSKNIIGMAMSSNSKKLEGSLNTKTIIDLKDSCIIMLMDHGDERTSMSMKMPQDKSAGSDSSYKIKPPIKTGKSKMILGVLCYEYLSENEEWKMQMWVNEKEINLWDAFSNGTKNSLSPSTNIQGMPLEMVMNNLKEESTIYYFVRSINKSKASTISTAGYKQF